MTPATSWAALAVSSRAPSPSAGLRSSAAAPAAAASSSRWRSRSRSARSASGSPAAGASWSTRATRSSRSSRRRAASAASPRADSRAACGDAKLAPGRGHLGRQLAGAGVRVEQLELARRPRQPAGLVLRRHLDAAARRAPRGRPGRSPVPRRTPGCGRSPCSRRATTSVSSPSGRRPATAASAGSSKSSGGRVELGLDVGLVAVRPDHAGGRLRPGEKADRLGEHRLPGPGLAREDVQPRPELELRALDQGQVVDVEPGSISARTPPGSA